MGNADNIDIYGDYANSMAAIDVVSNIFAIILFIGMGYGLYTLAKKMNIKNAWMGWVPLLQFYTMTQIAGVSFMKHIVIPILIIMVIAFSGAIAMFSGGAEGFVIIGIITGIAYIVAYIYYLVKFIQILSATSKRTGRGGWTTAGLFFVPFIMYPVIAIKYKKDEKTENKEEEKVVEL